MYFETMVEPVYASRGRFNAPPGEKYDENTTALYQDDGVWILSASISIFSMTSGLFNEFN